MQCVVLAGGLGTRLGARTRDVPKGMVRVAGEPFVQRQLALLADQGFSRVILGIGHLGSQVRDFVGDGGRFGLVVEYADEGEELRGTGGALRLAFDAGLLENRFAVLYGDSYLPIDVTPVWEAATRDSRPALMTVYRDPGGLPPRLEALTNLQPSRGVDRQRAPRGPGPNASAGGERGSS